MKHRDYSTALAWMAVIVYCILAWFCIGYVIGEWVS